MKNEHSEFGRKINFHKREEKRLRLLCTDLSQQVSSFCVACKKKNIYWSSV